MLNGDLFSRNSESLNKWLPFLYYTFEAYKILPKYKGTVYRGITNKILDVSNLYVPGISHYYDKLSAIDGMRFNLSRR